MACGGLRDGLTVMSLAGPIRTSMRKLLFWPSETCNRSRSKKTVTLFQKIILFLYNVINLVSRVKYKYSKVRFG
jgi:hypothetical protein